MGFCAPDLLQGGEDRLWAARGSALLGGKGNQQHNRRGGRGARGQWGDGGCATAGLRLPFSCSRAVAVCAVSSCGDTLCCCPAVLQLGAEPRAGRHEEPQQSPAGLSACIAAGWWGLPWARSRVCGSASPGQACRRAALLVQLPPQPFSARLPAALWAGGSSEALAVQSWEAGSPREAVLPSQPGATAGRGAACCCQSGAGGWELQELPASPLQLRVLLSKAAN